MGGSPFRLFVLSADYTDYADCRKQPPLLINQSANLRIVFLPAAFLLY
jgi:hypothetical protein